MTLSQGIGVVEINTLWLFRYLQLGKKRTKVVSFHRLSGTGMTSLIHLSPLLKCLMTVCQVRFTRAFKGLICPPSEPPGEIMSFGVSPVNYSDSDSVLRGVRAEMAKREKNKKWERDSHNKQFRTVEFRIGSGCVC